MYVLSPVGLSLTLAPHWLRERVAKTLSGKAVRVPMVCTARRHVGGFTHDASAALLPQFEFAAPETSVFSFRASSGFVR